MHDVLEIYRDEEVLCQFEPKKGVADYPKMLETIINFVNSRKTIL
jgi:hypothetical protein